MRTIFLKWVQTSLASFCLFSFFSTTTLTEKIVDSSGIKLRSSEQKASTLTTRPPLRERSYKTCFNLSHGDDVCAVSSSSSFDVTSMRAALKNVLSRPIQIKMQKTLKNATGQSFFHPTMEIARNISIKHNHYAQWFRLRQPSCGPWLESQAQHRCFFQIVMLKLKLKLMLQ